jgi:hypothetical protein
MTPMFSGVVIGDVITTPQKNPSKGYVPVHQAMWP